MPGFTFNVSANWTRFYGHPAYKDFGLREKGLEYFFPDESEAMVFDNDTCLVEYSAMKVIDPITGATEMSHENLQKSLNEIRRFSQRDADTAEELFRRYMKTWKSAMAEYRYSPPVPWGEKNALEKLPYYFRVVVLLYDVEGFSYNEIATIVKIPVGTVMSRLNRGRSLLRKKLKEIDPLSQGIWQQYYFSPVRPYNFNINDFSLKKISLFADRHYD